MFPSKVGIAIAMIATGIVSAAIYNWSRPTEQPKRESPTVASEANEPQKANEGNPVSVQIAESKPEDLNGNVMTLELDMNQVELGDQFLQVGNYRDAKRAYIKAANEFKGDVSASLLLRLAIATEQLGDIPNADQLYQKSVRQSNRRSAIRLLGLIGVARAWQKDGQIDQSHELLAELFLRHSSDQKLHEEIRFQIAYQLASVVQHKYLASQNEESPLREIEFHWCEPSIDAMLELISYHDKSNKVSKQESPPKLQQTFDILQRPSADVNLIAVDTVTKLISLEEILQQYASLASLKFELSPEAKRLIRGRSARLELSGMSLATVLDQLLSPLKLAWSQQDDVITVQKYSELGEGREEFEFQLAQRSLRNIELSFPTDLRRESSLLHRGNLNLMRKRFVEALENFAELEKRTPNDELAAKLSFNSALIVISQGNPDLAIKRLFFVVDQSLNQALQSKSYAWIARLELEHGESDRAVYAASRGLSLAVDEKVREDLLMNHARAYMFESDPFSTNRVLFNYADSVISPRAQRLASVLSAYSRFLGMIPEEGLRNEGERMVVALAAVQPDDTETFVDKLLVGRAFYEVGFASQSNQLLERALDEAPHKNWRRRVAFELANNRFRSGDFKSAAELFQTVVDESSDESQGGQSLLSQFKLAECALASKQPDLCLQFCKQIWELDLNKEQKLQTLSLMGLAYQRLDRHHVAAICFSGMLPHQFNDVNQLEKTPSSTRPVSHVLKQPPK
jgi:tetratricopeptide (TPR) repeat protein